MDTVVLQRFGEVLTTSEVVPPTPLTPDLGFDGTDESIYGTVVEPSVEL